MPTTAIIWTAIVSLYAGMFFGWVASSLCRAVRDVDDELDEIRWDLERDRFRQ